MSNISVYFFSFRISSEISDSERKFLADQACTLEKKCELLKKQIDLQRLNFESKLKERSATKESEKEQKVRNSFETNLIVLYNLFHRCPDYIVISPLSAGMIISYRSPLQNSKIIGTFTGIKRIAAVLCIEIIVVEMFRRGSAMILN